MPSWDSDGDPDWVGAGDGPGDLIAHFVPKENRLSVYEVAEDQIARVCAAFAANRQNVQHVHYSVIDVVLLQENRFTLEAEPGDCPDADVNSWHRDVVRLSARRLADLALLFRERGVRRRVLHKDVGKLINVGIAEGRIKRAALDPSLLKELEKPVYRP
jgi:hypothetical protein